MKKKKRIGWVLFSLLIVSIPLATSLGATNYPLSKVLLTILGKKSDPAILYLRLPRVLLGGLVGASLSVCGVSMQALVRNELADPFILGISSGASAFAAIDLIFGTFAFLGLFQLPLSAFFGAILTIVLVFSLGSHHGKIHISTMLLSGVVLSMIMDGLTNMVLLLAPNALGLHNASFWLSGSLAGARLEYLGLPLIGLILSMFFLSGHHRDLDALSLGESQATTLGVHVKKMQMLLILVSSLLAGISVALSGTIGFVGLIAPHFARLFCGSKHKAVILYSALLGALLIIWTDVLARTLFAPEEIPIGVLSAMIGGPIFIWMLKHKRRNQL